jgi:hypothetical protein
LREESDVKRIDEVLKEAFSQKIIPGRTHLNHKCPLFSYFYGGRGCDVCRKGTGIRHG